jgi:hypothetical protein
MIEETLFGDFLNTPYRHWTCAIFQCDLKKTQKYVATHNVNEAIQEMFGSHDVSPPFVWVPAFKLPPGPTGVAQYSVLKSVWFRVNGAHILCGKYPNKKRKLYAFIDAHLPLMRLLDGHSDPLDSSLPTDFGYKSAGKTTFDDDRNYISVQTKRFPLRRLPLDVLREAFPSVPWWTPDDVKPHLTQEIKDSLEDLRVESWTTDDYYASLYVMRQIRDLYAKTTDPEILDALWLYYLAFLDYVLGTDPALNCFNYPHDNRAFCAYDLPSAYHLLITIPLRGEKVNFGFLLGKFISKSLPYAGARRKLLEKTEQNIEYNEGFWKFFIKLFYCMFLDVYPHSMSPKRRNFDLRQIKRVHEIVLNQDALREALTRKSQMKDQQTMDDLLGFKKENNKGCVLVFTAFRLWMCLMTREQHHYKKSVNLDWDEFEQKVVLAGDEIRDSDIFQKDCFADARTRLLKKHKVKVHRYRKDNIIKELHGYVMKTLEKDIFKEADYWNNNNKPFIGDVFLQQHLDVLNQDHPTQEVKTKLLNLMLHIPREDWFSPLSLSIMRIHGGISELSVSILLELISLYHTSAKPMHFKSVIEQFEVNDFKVICWYMHVLSVMNKIDFEILTQHQVEATDRAMSTSRYVLFPKDGQVLPERVFNVFVTICCDQIKTLEGQKSYGHRKIAYDIDRGIFVCATNYKKTSLSKEAIEQAAISEIQKQRKAVRSQRQDFNKIPCTNNPVLAVPLRGFMLIYKKTQRYLFCPRCAAFHRYTHTGWKGDNYACAECRRKDEEDNGIHRTCHVCMVTLTEPPHKSHHLRLVDPVPNNGDVRNVIKHVYLCKEHYKKLC